MPSLSNGWFAVLSLCLVGCFGESAPGPDGAARPGPPGPAVEQAAATPGGGGGEFVYYHGPDPQTIDPGLLTDTYGANLAINLFEGLTVWDEMAQVVRPGVAASWEVSPYPTVYTFHLREDAVWSDGTPVLASDFVAAWLRVVDPDHDAGFATLLYPIIGARELHTGLSDDVTIFGAKATGPHTLVVTLESPTAHFLELTASAPLLPVNPECVKRYDWTWTAPENIVVNGPFLLSSWAPGDRIVLERNPTYHDAGSILVDRVVAWTVPPADGLLESYRSGALHWTGFAGEGVEVDAWPSMTDDPGYREFGTLSTGYLIVNTRRWPLDDVRVRQALAHALDRGAIARHGQRAPTEHLVPEGLTNYEPPPGLSLDPARAQALLADAGYPGGEGFPAIEIAVDAQPANVAAMEDVAAQWREVLGIDARVYRREWRVHDRTITDGKFDVARGAWVADYPDPMNFVELYLRGSELNYPAFEDQIFDQFVAEAQQTSDGESHDRLLLAAEQRLLDQAPVIPLYHPTSRCLLSPSVRGYEDNLLNVHLLRYLSLGRGTSAGSGG